MYLDRSETNSAIRLEKVSETKAKLLSSKESNTAFYGYVRSKQKVRSHVAKLKKKDNTLTGSDEKATNELSSLNCARVMVMARRTSELCSGGLYVDL